MNHMLNNSFLEHMQSVPLPRLEILLHYKNLLITLITEGDKILNFFVHLMLRNTVENTIGQSIARLSLQNIF